MPEGLVRTDLNKTGTDYRKGTPVVLPHEYGNVVIEPKSFGNPVPPVDPSFNSNPVTWPPSSDHFGNNIVP